MKNKIMKWLSFFLLALTISACLPFTIGIPREIEPLSLPELKLEFNQPVFQATAFDGAPQLKRKCSGDSSLVVRGTGKLISEARSVGDFTQILLTGLGEVFITQAESNGLMVQAEESVLAYVETDVAGDQLRLGIDKAVCALQTEVGITYYVTVKDLNLVHIIGAGEIQIKRLQTESLNIELDGSARIVMAELRSDTLQVHVNGTGVIQLAGEVSSQTVNLNGFGQYQAGELVSQSADIKLNGTGNVELWTSSDLSIEINGLGSVRYYGNPVLHSSTSGGGAIVGLGTK